MADIAIVTDSTSDLTESMRQEHGIHMVPLNVHFGEDSYKDGVTLQPGAFYDLLKSHPEHPKTSQPSPEDFKATYTKLLDEGKEIISIHISHKLSGTLQSARVARNDLGTDKIHIVDSQFVSLALGAMAIECSKAAGAGKSAAEIVGLAEEIAARMQLYFIVDTLEYLQKGGRIGKAAAVIGGLLNIKPILMVNDGLVCPFEKVRGSGKVFGKMANIFAGHLTEQKYKDIHLGLIHAATPEQLQALREKIDPIYNTSGALVGEIGPVVGTHAGPGAVGLFFY